MKAFVDQLSEGLIEQYKLYLETFLVDLWSAEGFVEFRVGYSLRADHRLRSFTVKVEADTATSDLERRAIIAAVFVEIEDHVDDAIATSAALPRH